MSGIKMEESRSLRVSGLNCYYGKAHILKDVSFTASTSEVLCILGRNGAGKTTTLKAIMGLVRPRSGKVVLDGVDLTRVPPHTIVSYGLSYVPQGRRLFPDLTVEENLRISPFVRKGNSEILQEIWEIFPVLRERVRQKAGTLSGGEQQMLAIARALSMKPKFLLMDEPTEGLMPILVSRVLESIQALKKKGLGILLVEQRVDAAFRVADRVLIMENGRIEHETTPQQLNANSDILLRYLGIRR
ncbi:MAG: ABC transporter ATP-binding protein [Candidatus Caldarchaeum sp.]